MSGAERLTANMGRAFRGTEVKGVGFTLSFEEAAALVHSNAENASVIVPYITGEDPYSG